MSGIPENRRINFTGHTDVLHFAGRENESWLSFNCGHCHKPSNGAVIGLYPAGRVAKNTWLICPGCGWGSVITPDGIIYPGEMPGLDIEGLPEEVQDAYDEARRCVTVNAFCACELICRKILMHVAVDKGDSERKTFTAYIDYLTEQGFITAPMKLWVTRIKDHANESTHLLKNPGRERAIDTFNFTAQLLRIVYEMEYLNRKYEKEE